MAGVINFEMTAGDVSLRVQFREGEGVHSKRAVAVLVSNKEGDIFGSTGFDAHACGIFAMIYDMGSAFAGCLYRDGRTVGNILVGTHHSGKPYLDVEVERVRDLVRLDAYLEESDIERIKALFAEIGSGA